MIEALILAAGESKRMGLPKPLLRFLRSMGGDDTTFLEQIVSVLRQSEVDRVTVVLGAQAETIRASTDLFDVEIVVNESYHQGQLSSLRAGLESVPAETEAIVLCLVDNPFITTRSVDGVIGAFRLTGKPIVVPAFQGQRGHPTLFARVVFDELRHAPADQGARSVVQANKDRIFEMDTSDPGVLVRIDTPADYLSYFGTPPRIIAS